MATKKTPKRRNWIVLGMIERTGSRAGFHKNRKRATAKGHSRKVKHKGKQEWTRP